MDTAEALAAMAATLPTWTAMLLQNIFWNMKVV
jgi:hypothetical protein